MADSITLSLQELISSGCLSESTFSFAHEDDGSGTECSSPFQPEDRLRLRHLNAAKVSLLLSKVFVNRFPATHENSSVASLHSSNIFVHLKCHLRLDLDSALVASPESEDAPDEGKEPTGFARAHPAPILSHPSADEEHRHEDDQGGSTPRQQRRSSSASSFEAALDEIFVEDDDVTTEREDAKRIRQKTDDFVPVVDAGSDRNSPPNSNKNFPSLGKMRIPISDTGQFRAVDRADMRDLHCALTSVGILFDPLNDGSPPPPAATADASTALKVLGTLIATVFSQDDQPITSMYPHSIAPDVADAAISNDACLSPRRSKPRRNEDGSLFSRLVEGGLYPISICRLLSDMIDVGPNGKTDSPFESFDEVIRDLEQMTLYPQTFLFDPENSLAPSLVFGQRHFGREAEVTKMLEISTRLEQSAQAGLSEDGRVETVFISGIAGCGKTHIARRVGNFLSSLGWMVLEAKFDRCTEYQSREVICSVFDKLMSKFVEMKHGNDENDIEFAARAEQAISDTFGSAGLSALADFIPSIHNFCEGIEKRTDLKESQHGGKGMSHWQLIILLSKLLGAVLRLDRFIMICLDDLQWCDSNMLMLINEVLVSVAQYKREKQHLLFVGTYRHNEIDDGHPLRNRLSNLRRNERVSVTQINLPSLSGDDVCRMLMTEMRLPRRLVRRLADVVHKKTSGHAIFVVELLNLLVRKSTIAYSPQLLRFTWDPESVSAVKTGDNVASLIVSNLTSLHPSILWTLCIVSCFGFKSETSLLRLLQGSSLQPEGGFDLESLVERGFVELSGSVVSFSHDLIQQHVYEKMPMDKRRQLHLDIGLVLAAKTALDSSLSRQPIEAGMEKLYICDGGDEQGDDSSITILSLSGIATTQINKAGPEFITDRIQRIRFAGWNLHASNESVGKSNFRAALYYCKNGILFLGEYPWLGETRRLSVELHEGAAFASFAVGNVEDVAEYTNAIIDSENVDFDQSLVAHYMLIRSLETMGHYTDTIARGLAVLRRLDLDIPVAPSPAVIMQTMIRTSSIASQYRNFNSFGLSRVIHPKQKNILKMIDSVAVACFFSTSPYLPLVACATMIYSLQQGIFHCEESASAFAIFGYFKVFLAGDLDEGQQWGNLAFAILENSKGNSAVRARIYLFGFLYFWFIPIKESCRSLYETYTMSMRCGDVDSAMYALCLEWRFQFFGGYKLSIVQSNYVEYMKSIINYSEALPIQGVLRKKNLNELMGISDEDPFLVLGGTICNEAEVLEHAKLKNNIQLIEEVYLTRFLSAFWIGDFIKAMESFKLMAALPSSKMPKIQGLYYTFYRGIVAYRLFREGNGEHLLTEGNEVLSKVQSWRKKCDHVENKLLLLQAEYFASMCNRNSAKEKYEASIKSARDHGFVHEQGLAYECMGEYFSSIIEIPEAKQCFRQAHECYMQWGAIGKAEKIKRDHGFDQENDNSSRGLMKHERDWEDSV